MEGEPYEERDPAYPPLYTGAVGNPPPPADLTVVGVRRRQPVRRPLRPRRPAAEQLVDDAVPRQRQARPGPLPRRPAADHQQLPRGPQPVRPAPADASAPAATSSCTGCSTATTDAPTRPTTPARRGASGRRGRRAQPDGLRRRHRQPDHDDELLDRYVWIADRRRRAGVGGRRQLPRGAGDPHVRRVLGPHPPRRAGGPDRAAQVDGAPLDGEVELDVPDYAADPDGKVTPLDAHIRLANPRTPETED